MKIFAKRFPRMYLYISWLILGLAGVIMGLGVELTVLLVLILGYFVNIIWLMRQCE